MKQSTCFTILACLILCLGPVGSVVMGTDAKDSPFAVTEVNPTSAELNDLIRVSVRGLDQLVGRLKSNPGGKPRSIVLYLDEMPLKGLVPDPPTDLKGNVLNFRLVRNQATGETWNRILAKPGSLSREVKVSIGLDDDWAIPSTARLQLRVIPGAVSLIMLVFLIVVVASLVYLSWRKGMLREPNSVGPIRRLSLARTQMAWWFVLILTSYLFIGLVNHDFTTGISSSALVLLGISGATFLGSATIEAQPGRVKAPARRWWMDLISDGNGVSLDRFQIVAWTLILGIVFIVNVFDYLMMPQFDQSLLALMGISAGTYLGYKLPQTASSPPTLSIRSVPLARSGPRG